MRYAASYQPTILPTFRAHILKIHSHMSTNTLNTHTFEVNYKPQIRREINAKQKPYEINHTRVGDIMLKQLK